MDNDADDETEAALLPDLAVSEKQAEQAKGSMLLPAVQSMSEKLPPDYGPGSPIGQERWVFAALPVLFM